MHKIRSMIGMSVICRGRRIGRLVQAELSPDLKHMEGIWVDCGLRGTRYIPAEQLCMIGEKAVIADHRGKRKKCNAASMLYRAVSTDGSRIGAIVGAEVDEISFMVRALELTRGFWDDLYSGRERIEAYCMQSSRVVIRDPDHEDEREEEA